MNKSILSFASMTLLVFGACQNIENKKNDPSAISAQSIAVHDEIMPQITTFDKHTVLIDSLLGNLAAVKSQDPSIDTSEVRSSLTDLKVELESATDKMMTWMKDFEPDSNETSYQQAQLDTISNLKNTFSKVSQDADRFLAPYKK
ncbi:transposase [Sphingobacterium shayense]|uniref:transposase n=1 Tax=Sphingobacterium shayense TaxID=626343 RepID=UPI0015519BC2|nr:transposase [Sphingobacterium shayense]NQD70743.1 transposase [Sphingobacterium shayense]